MRMFKNLDRSDWLNFIGLVLGVVAAIFFYWGSEAMPWLLQTWAGNSIPEAVFRSERSNEARIGFVLLAVNFSFQATAIFFCKRSE